MARLPGSRRRGRVFLMSSRLKSVVTAGSEELSTGHAWLLRDKCSYSDKIISKQVLSDLQQVVIGFCKCLVVGVSNFMGLGAKRRLLK
jgi:hypothetical protein